MWVRGPKINIAANQAPAAARGSNRVAMKA
jgi:hypothetical protein